MIHGVDKGVGIMFGKLFFTKIFICFFLLFSFNGSANAFGLFGIGKKITKSILHKSIKSPKIKPKLFVNKRPSEVSKLAIKKGLIPQKRGLNGNKHYLDPITRKPRVMIHPFPKKYKRHIHINTPNGKRLDKFGKMVGKKTPEAHLPLKY